MNRVNRKLLVPAAGLLILFALVAVGAHPLVASSEDISMRQAVDRALENFPPVEMAEVRRERARLESRQAADAADEISDDAVQSYQMALVKYFYPRQARSAHRLARSEEEATIEDVRMQVQLAYRSLQTAENMTRPARAGVRAAAEALRAAEVYREEDMISREELLRAEARLEAARSLSDQVGAAREKAERALRILLGYDEHVPIELSARRPVFEPLGDVRLGHKAEQALEERYELKEVAEMRDLAEYRLDLARQYPSDPDGWPVDLPPDLIPGFEGFGSGGDNDEYAERIAELDVREAGLARRLLESQIESEVRDLYREVQSAEQLVREREANAKAAVEEYRQTASKHTEDMATRLELFTAYAERVRADAQYLEAVHSHEMAKARFHHSYGPGGALDDHMEGGSERGEDTFGSGAR